jgi:hypothetical protein
MHFNALRQTLQTVSPGLERIFPNRASAVYTIFGEPHAAAKIIQFIFQDSRPAFVKGESLARVRNDSPSQRIAVNENVVHSNSSEKFC